VRDRSAQELAHPGRDVFAEPPNELDRVVGRDAH
jgi:hypothetical protein